MNQAINIIHSAPSLGTILDETTIERSDPGIATCTNNTKDGSNNSSTTTSTGTSTSTRTAIIPQIEGSAYITQYSEVAVGKDYDPFPEGYKVADICYLKFIL